MAVSKGFELATLGSGLDTNQSTGEVVTINMDTDVVAEGSVNLYYTDERVDDRVSNLLVEGTGITLTYNDAANTLTISGQSLITDTDDVPEGSTNLYYTDTRVNTFLGSGSATSITTTGDVTIGGNLTINGTTTTINSTELAVDDLNITIASGAADALAANGAGITVDGANATIIYNGIDDRWVLNKTPYFNTLRLLTTNDLTGSDNYAFKSITDGINTAVADSNTDTFKIRVQDQIEATVTNDDATHGDSVLFGHANSGVTPASYGSSTAIPVITVDAQGHITAATTASITTSWTLSDGTTSQTISGGDTLTVIDGIDIDAVVSVPDQLTINNTSTLQTVTGRGATTTNSVGIGTDNITSGYTFDVNGTSFLRDAVTVQDTAFSTAYNSITGAVIDSSHIDGSAAGYGNSITFTSRNTSPAKKAAIALYQQGIDTDDVNLRFFVSSSNTFTDPVTLALELKRGGQVKVSDAYTLPTADGAANQVLITNGSGALSFATIDTTIDWNVSNNYAFKTVSVVDSTAGFSFTATGDAVADSNTDTLTLISGTGINLNVDATNDAVVVHHGDTSSVADLTGTANTFVSGLTFDTYGHVLTRTTAAVDFDVSTNYAYKFMSDGTNTAGAASNVDTFTFVNGTDTTAVVNAAADSVTFNNTSTLDSVTGRGNTTTNNITVGDMTVNGNLTVNGSTTTLDTANLLVEDPVIVLAKNQATPTNDIGFVFQRYSAPTAANYNVAVVWNETDDRLVFGETTETGADNAISTSSEWMTIVNDGDVGIGTTNPALRLDVHGGAIRIANTTSYNFGFDTIESSIILGTAAGQARRIMVDQGGYGRNLIGITANDDIEIGNQGTSLIRNMIFQHSDRGGAGHIIFNSLTGENARFERNGNVGFGTSAPATKLHLYANNDGLASNNTIRFEDADAGTAVGQQLGLIEFYGNDTSTGSSGQKAYIGAFAETLTPQAYLAFATDGLTGTATERVRITSAGDVGIGTTNPAQLLHVRGSNATTIRALVENGSTGQASLDLKNSEGEFRILTDNGILRIYDQTDSTDRFAISTLGAITFNNAYTFPAADGSANQALITDGAGNITFGSLSSTIDWNVAANYAFQTIATPAGTNPVADSNTDTLTLANGADISITGNATTDTVTIANTSTLQTVTGRGATTTNSVGIGTNDTSSKLVVMNNVDTSTDWYSNTQSTLRLRNTNASGNAVLKFENTLSRIVYGVDSASDKLIFSSRQSLNTTSEVVTFNNDGEVGIGTVDPTARLHIGPFNGSTTSPHLLLTSANNAFGWRIDTQDFGGGDVPLRVFRRTNGVDTESLTVRNENGRVGIGSTNPEQQLTVGTGNLQVNDGWGWFKADAPTTNIALQLGQYTTDSNTSLVDIYTDDTSYILNTVLKRYISSFRWSRTSPSGTFNPMELYSFGDSTNNITRFSLYHQLDPATSTSRVLDVRLATGGTDPSYIRRGNVGIGTNNPLAKLHIQSDTAGDAFGPDTLLLENTNATTGETAVAYKNTSTGTNYWFTGLNQGNDFDFAYGTSFGSGFSKLTITNDGNVGIGTTVPGQLLHVYNGTGPAYLTIQNNNYTSNNRIEFKDLDGSSNVVTSYIQSSWYNGPGMLFHAPRDGSGFGFGWESAAGTELMRLVTSSGNLGIGTTNPYEQVHVFHEDKYGLMLQRNNYTDNIPNLIRFSNSGTDGVYSAYIGSVRAAGLLGAGDLVFGTSPSISVGNDQTVERMRILTNGNVGIGLTNPTADLHVSGNSIIHHTTASATNLALYVKDSNTTSTAYNYVVGISRQNSDTPALYIGNDGSTNAVVAANNSKLRIGKDVSGTFSEYMTIDTAGNVGIGTTTPQANLHISSGTAGDATLLLEADTDNNDEADNPSIEFRQDGGFVTGFIRLESTGGVIATGTIDNALVIESKGGLNSQGIQFVAGGQAAAQVGGSTKGNLAMTITGTGNVGIGTAGPAAKLHVEGAVRIDSAYEHDSATQTLSTTTQTVVATWSATTYGGGKVVIQAYDTVSGDRQMSEMLVTHDGTNVEYTEYANISTGNTLATYIFDISGGNVRLLATSSSANATEYKIVETLVLA